MYIETVDEDCVCMFERGRVLVIKVSETVVNGYEREGGLYLEHVCEKHTSGESV